MVRANHLPDAPEGLQPCVNSGEMTIDKKADFLKYRPSFRVEAKKEHGKNTTKQNL